MRELSLYSSYERAEIYDFIGEGKFVREECEGRWLIGETAMGCLARLGSGAPESYLKSGSRFHWVGKGKFMGRGKPPGFVPAEAIGGETGGRVIYLFLEKRGGAAFVYAGTLGGSTSQSYPREWGDAEARFELAPTLPSELWMELAGSISAKRMAAYWTERWQGWRMRVMLRRGLRY